MWKERLIFVGKRIGFVFLTVAITWGITFLLLMGMAIVTYYNRWQAPMVLKVMLSVYFLSGWAGGTFLKILNHKAYYRNIWGKMMETVVLVALYWLLPSLGRLVVIQTYTGQFLKCALLMLLGAFLGRLIPLGRKR